MPTADLGQPILLFILVFWALFAVAAVLNGFMRRGGREEVRAFFRRLTDTSHNKHAH